MKILRKYRRDFNRAHLAYENEYDNAPGLPIYAWYFNERERIRLARQDNKPRDTWTDDTIFKEYRFTNVFREHDRVSQELFESIIGVDNHTLRMFNAVVFRTFNLHSTYITLAGDTPITDWHKNEAMERLDILRSGNFKIFNGAYIVANSLASGFPKHQFYVRLLTDIWNDKELIMDIIFSYNSIEKTVKAFMEYPGYGGFLGYEFAMDMEMLWLLDDPVDKYTWANPGPGARRGLNFVFGRDRNFRVPTKQALQEMRWLYDISEDFIEHHVGKIDMRCIENALCETSKYASVLTTGRAKRKYR